MVDPDFVFIVSYSCPRCHAPLEARALGSPTWLRCPACGRAGLLPERNRPQSSRLGEASSHFLGDLSTLTASAPLPIQPRGMAPLPPSSPSKTPTIRIALGIGFFLSTCLCLLSILESNSGRGLLFGAFGLVTLILLRSRKGPPRPERSARPDGLD